jgi:hypothetical protein
MSHETQLQNIVSWAVPRRVEEWNDDRDDRSDPCRWGSYVPSNATQSVINPASFGWDYLLMLDSKVAALLELKYIDASSDTQSKLAFNTGQLEFLQTLEPHMLVRVCFNADKELTHRLAPPNAEEASGVLSSIRAVPPSEANKNGGRGANKTLLALIDGLLAYTEDGGGEHPAIIQAAFSKNSLIKWEKLAEEIATTYGSGNLPPNLLFAMAGQQSLSMISGESAKLVLDFLASPAYQQLKHPVHVIGKAYLDCLKSSHQDTATVRQNFDAVIDQLAGLAKQFTFFPNDPAWTLARDKAIEEMILLQAETQQIMKTPARKSINKLGIN